MPSPVMFEPEAFEPPTESSENGDVIVGFDSYFLGGVPLERRVPPALHGGATGAGADGFSRLCRLISPQRAALRRRRPRWPVARDHSGR
jgi:hypothetical protein